MRSRSGNCVFCKFDGIDAWTFSRQKRVDKRVEGEDAGGLKEVILAISFDLFV